VGRWVALVGGWPSWAGGPRGRVALVDGWPLWAGSGWMVLGLGCCDYLKLPDSPWGWKGTMVRMERASCF